MFKLLNYTSIVVSFKYNTKYLSNSVAVLVLEKRTQFVSWNDPTVDWRNLFI